jgi:hypothetical protein
VQMVIVSLMQNMRLTYLIDSKTISSPLETNAKFLARMVSIYKML